MKPYNKTVQNHNFFNVDWLVGTVCNYSCSYCAPYLHDNKHKFIDIDSAKKFLNQLVDEHPDKTLVFIMSGGEPTLWPGLPEFMREAKQKDAEIQLITNGSRSLEWWDKNAENIKLLVVSFHWEYADPDHIEKLCKMLVEKHKLHIKVNVLVMKEKFEESYKFARRLEKNVPGIIIELRPLRQDHGMYLIDYTPEQLERLQTENRFGKFGKLLGNIIYQDVYTDSGERLEPNNLMLKKENSWTGWDCHIGLESLKVFYDGTVQRGNCDVGGPIGNIKDGIVLPTEPIVCDRDLCRCVTDIRATKVRK